MTKKNREKWHPTISDKSVARAAKALVQGEAGPHDQQMFMNWLIETACQTYDEPFDPDNPHITSYVLGRRSVGLAVVKHINLNMKVFEGQGDGS